MDVLWDTPDGPVSGRDIADCLPDRAYTTVLTVLERLGRKEFVRRTTQGRVHFFQAADSREAFVAEVMIDAMGATRNRGAVLARFAESVSPDEAELLSQALRDAVDPERQS
jgi:predicted transcriptional regulator